MRKLIPLLLLFVVGCAGAIVPQTGQERYVVADAAFKALLVTVQDGVVRGTIHGDGAVAVKRALVATKTALDIWAINPDNLNAETAALLALTSVREVLRSLQPRALV